MKNKTLKLSFKVFAVLILFVLVVLFFSFQFRFNFHKDDIIQIASSSRQYVYFEDQLDRIWDYEHLDKLYVTDIINNRYQIEGKYQFFEKDEFGKKFLSDTQMVKFEQDVYGRMYFLTKSIFPTLRSVPIFIESDLAVGARWWAEAEEVVDFSSIGIDGFSITVPFIVSYQYIGDENNLAIIKAHYSNVYGFEKDNVYRMGIEYAPKLYSADVDMTLFWDKQLGYVVKFSDVYAIYIVLVNGSKWKFTGTTDGSMNVIQKWDDNKKDQLIQNIKSNLPPELKGKIDIVKNEKGIVINLGEIFFDFNKYDIKQSELSKLQSLALILKKYFYNYQIAIEGYTDDIGSEQYNLELSTKRAKTIFDFLISTQSINPYSSYYIGYGEANPLYPNTSEANRAKNRRVQIVIMDF